MSRPSNRARHVSRRPGTPVDGGYSVVEAAITIPAIIVMTMIVVQYVLLWHGRNVAESAARDGLDAARGFEAPSGAGQAVARSYLADVAPTLLSGTDVKVTRTPTTVRVQVNAVVLRVIPFGEYTVSESVEGPIERFVADGRGFATTAAEQARISTHTTTAAPEGIGVDAAVTCGVTSGGTSLRWHGPHA